MKLQQLLREEPDSLFLILLQKLLDQDATVYLDALGKTQMHGTRDKLEPVRVRRTGRVQKVKQGHLIFDTRRTAAIVHGISSSLFVLEQPVDEHYTIRKSGDGTFTVVDA